MVGRRRFGKGGEGRPEPSTIHVIDYNIEVVTGLC